MGSLAILLLITLSISAFIGWLNSISTKQDLNEQEKTDIFLNSTIGGLIGGLIGSIIGHFLGLKSTSNVDGLFTGLSVFASSIEYLKIFLSFWIISTIVGGVYYHKFLK